MERINSHNCKTITNLAPFCIFYVSISCIKQHILYMRVSVEISADLVKEIMELTGETKMSAGIAKAVELFANRKKAVAIIRSLRESPLDYAHTNEEIEDWGNGSSSQDVSSTSYRSSKKS